MNMVEIYSIKNGGRRLIDANSDYVQKDDYDAIAVEYAEYRKCGQVELDCANVRIALLEEVCTGIESALLDGDSELIRKALRKVSDAISTAQERSGDK
jgi:hypothetical protein